MLFHPRKWLEPHLVDALDVLRFELTAWKGRLFSPRRLETRGLSYLQLGCWETVLDGFLNTDFFLNRKAEAYLDARFKLPFDDNTWLGVYTHHVVEHLSWEDGCSLFRECNRVLKPNGVFRMVVPDLEIFLRLYVDNDPAARQRLFDLYPVHIMDMLNVKTPLEMVDYVFRDHKFNRHLSAWDWETAECRLMEAGFSKVIRQTMNRSQDPRLAERDKPHWESFSLYVEAVK